MSLELSDVFPQSEPAPSIRRARVISISGRMLKVDLGGGIDIPSLDSCNPLPDQWVYIIGEGSSMMAIGAIGGVYRQATLTATSSTTTTVTGLVNGVSRAVTKAGEFTVVAGNELPLFWGADGSEVWVLGKAGVPYIPPPTGGGGSGGGGGVTSGTATYAATVSGAYWSHSAAWASNARPSQGTLGDTSYSGAYSYGFGRFRELQGRTITGFRINVSRYQGTGAINFYTHGYSGVPAGAPTFSNGPVGRNGSGWIALPTSMANWLIAGSGTGGIGITGNPSVTLNGLPSGTLQFDWRK